MARNLFNLGFIVYFVLFTLSFAVMVATVHAFVLMASEDVYVLESIEIPIRYGFCQITDIQHRDYILHDIEAAIVDYDISIFLEYEMRSIGQKRSLRAGWPGELAIRQLV